MRWTNAHKIAAGLAASEGQGRLASAENTSGKNW
jgi:hypothetical protein